MKLSTNFLKDYVDIDVPVKTLAEDMTRVGNEYDFAGNFIEATNLVIGEIKECEEHPDSDHLHVCQVDVGDEVLQIVCGAPNARKGLKVIVALPGAVLPGDFTIKKGNIRGVESNGMMCSMAELGLESKFLTEADKEGIHELPLDAPVGKDPIKFMEMDDGVIDFELTANRGDLLSILGMAHEIAAIYESHFNDYDKLIAFSSLPTLQKINDLPSDGGSCIELRGFKPDDIIPSSSALQDSIVEACYNQKLNNLCNVTNVYHTGAFYFTWLDLLDTNVVVILILIALVAGFTLVSCMFIIILERVNTIGILKALGATNAQIRGIFITLTERLVIIGMLIGNFIGITLTILQEKFHLIPLNPDAYYLNYVPVELNWAHILYLNLGVLVLTTLILVIPSQLVSTISPAKTIKYE